jgi:hypothetical protein
MTIIMCSFTTYWFNCKKHTFDLIEANCGASHPAPWPTVNITMSKECNICSPSAISGTRIISDVALPASIPPAVTPLNLVSDLTSNAPFPLYSFNAADFIAEIGSLDVSDDNSDSEQSGWDAEVDSYLNELKAEADILPEKFQELKTAVPKLAVEISVRFELTKEKSDETSEGDIQKTQAVYREALEYKHNKEEAPDSEKWSIEAKSQNVEGCDCKDDEKSLKLLETHKLEDLELEKAYKEKNRRDTLAALTNDIEKEPVVKNKRVVKGKSATEKTIIGEKVTTVRKTLSDTNDITAKPSPEESEVMKMIKKFEAASVYVKKALPHE